MIDQYDDRTWRAGPGRIKHIERESMPDRLGAVLSIKMVGREASYCGHDVTDWPLTKDDALIPCYRCLQGWYRDDDT